MCHSRAAAPENPSWRRTFRYACTLVMLSCSRLSRKLVRSSIMYRRPQSPLLPPLPAPAGAALDPAAAAAVSLPLPPFCCAMREESLESSAAASSACFAAWSRRRAAASSHCSRMSRMGRWLLGSRYSIKIWRKWVYSQASHHSFLPPRPLWPFPSCSRRHPAGR